VKALSYPWSSLTGVALSRPRSVVSSPEKGHRHGVLDAAVADLVAVHVERHVAALGQAAAVGELHPDLVLARRHRPVPRILKRWRPKKLQQ
jgi:hypothetical protein